MRIDTDDFSIVFNNLYPKLCRFLECLLADSEVAQDVAQEAFLRLHRFGVENLPGDEARFWLFRTARNLALNELDKRRTRTKFIDFVAGLFQRRAADPESELERAEQTEILLALLKSLPEDQRTALLLREREEMSYAEIAGVLGVSESKIKTDIFRARTALRARWNEHRKTLADFERRRNQA